VLGLFFSERGLSICERDAEEAPALSQPEGDQERYRLSAVCAVSLDDEAQLCGVYEEIIPTKWELGIKKVASEDSALETLQDKKGESQQ
jgi:hypothetical protein